MDRPAEMLPGFPTVKPRITVAAMFLPARLFRDVQNDVSLRAKAAGLCVLMTLFVGAFFSVRPPTGVQARIRLDQAVAHEPAGLAPIPQAPSDPALQTDLELVHASQLGGFQVVSQHGDHVLAGLGPRLTILDTSSPNHLKVIGQTTALPQGIVDIAANGNFAYLITETSGVYVSDITDPAHPVFVGFLDPCSRYYGISVSGTHAYIAGACGLQILDVSTSTDPHVVHSWSSRGSVYTAVISGEHAYVSTDGPTLRIVRIADGQTPSEVGAYGMERIEDMALAGHYLYVAAAWKGLRVVDVSDPAHPNEVGSYESNVNFFPQVVRLAGGVAYAGSPYRLTTIDITNPEAPSRAGHCSLAGDVQSLTISGKHGFVAVDGRLIVVGLADWPYVVSQFGLGYTSEVAVHDEFAYVITEDGLNIVNVSNPTNPIVVGSLDRWGLKEVIATGSLAYLHSWGGGLVVLSISDPAAPRQVAVFDTISVSEFAVSGNYAFMIDQDDKLHIVDFSSPASPISAGTYQVPGFARRIRVAGSFAFIAADNNTLLILDVSKPKNPTLVGSYEFQEVISDVDVAAPYAYVAVGYGGLRVIDFDDPANPIEVGQYLVSRIATRILVNGLRAYLVDGDDLVLLDVSSPASPERVASFSGFPQGIEAVAADDNLVFIADGVGGFVTLRLIHSVSASISPDGGSLSSGEDNTSYCFPPESFSGTVTITHSPLRSYDITLPWDLIGTGHVFKVEAVDDRGHPATPVRPYTITVEYTVAEAGAAHESTLALYSWDGLQWQTEISSVADTDKKTVTATPDHLSTWALAGIARHKAWLPVVGQDFAPLDLTTAGLEVTQAIQDDSNSVPLVVDRPTVVRVYAQTTSMLPVDHLYLLLSASRNGIPLPLSPLTVGPWTVFRNPSRSAYGESFNIPLPVDWTSGMVTLMATIDPGDAVAESDESNNSASETVFFDTVPPLSIKIVPVNYHHAWIPGMVCPAFTDGIDELRDQISRLFPLNAIDVSYRPPIDFTGHLDYEGFVKLLQQLTDLKHMDGAPASQVYYGYVSVVSDPTGIHSDCPVEIGGMAWLGQRVATGVATAGDLREYSGSVAAHEVGHTFGLGHAPCGTAEWVDIDYPYEDGSIGEYGFDAIRHHIWSPGAPAFTKDFMSYCGPEWVSDYNYVKLLRDQLDHGKASDHTSEKLVAQVRIVFGPDSAPLLKPLYVIPGWPTDLEISSDYVVDLVDDSGNVVVSQAVAIWQVLEESVQARAIYASIALPQRPVSMVRLLQRGVPVSQRLISAVSKATLPLRLELDPEADTLTLQWGSPSIPALVRFSYDNGVTWTTLGLDVIGGELRLDGGSLPGRQGWIEVRLGDTIPPVVGTVALQPE